jgi:hypothetical protein
MERDTDEDLFDPRLVPQGYLYCFDDSGAADTLSLPTDPYFSPDTGSFHQSNDSLPPPKRPPILPNFPRSPPDARHFPFAHSVSFPQPQLENDFQLACADRTLLFKPYELGFIPIPWPQRKRSLGDLVKAFFTKKRSQNSRFCHKLVNALKITDCDRNYFNLISVAWVADTVFKVDKVRFARLLGIKAIDGSLFHRQGNFPSHGFVEVDVAEAKQMISREELQGVDFDIVRLMKHESGTFTRGITPHWDNQCRWNGRMKREAVAETA